MPGHKPDAPFNNPFSGLEKGLKSGKKKAASAPAPKKPEHKAPPPAQLSRDFTDEDAASAALFQAAVGHLARGSAKAAAKESGADEALEPQSAGQRAAAGPHKAAAKKAPPAPQSGDAPNPPLTADEAQSFAQAMQGVRPVDAQRGRALVPPAPPAPLRHKSAERDYLTEFTEGKYEFALEYTEEFFEGHVMGLDPLVVAKLRAGGYSPEAHIDLHGYSAEQAYAALLDFIKSSYLHNRRQLVVVTGRGKNSPGGLGVLRQNMQEWLTREPLRRVVLAFCTAQPKDGGAGAIYVLLRKYRKNQGKVRWDISPPGL